MQLRVLFAVLTIGAASAMVAGCASGRAYFEPTQTRASRADGGYVQTRYMVPVETGKTGLLLHAEARTFRDEIGETGASFPTLQTRIWIHNDTDTKIELRLAEFSATDDQGSTFEFSRGRYLGSVTTVVIVAPRSRTYADAFFHLPNAYDVLSPGGMTLSWSLRIGNAEYRQTTRFARASDRAFHDPFLNLPLGL